MNSNRNSTVSGGFISKQSNGTDGASSAEPIKRTGQSGVSSTVPIKHYHPLRCQACFFLVIFISQSVQSPLRNINSPFGFHGAVNLSSDSNKRFVYDVGAYNSDDDKADENVGMLIGKGGEIVRNLQLSSGVKI
ncbi:BnaAnng34780D [Brassica napus]|uniref:BnaAnng34780D protein n=1 Tax=Brassica napus TaxID=3708 RepID=A0A078JT20_BRANA|nr:BnaAnng34780D [Brassica napus]